MLVGRKFVPVYLLSNEKQRDYTCRCTISVYSYCTKVFECDSHVAFVFNANDIIFPCSRLDKEAICVLCIEEALQGFSSEVP